MNGSSGSSIMRFRRSSCARGAARGFRKRTGRGMPDFAVHAVHGSSIGATAAPISAATADDAALRAVVDGRVGTPWNQAQHGAPHVSHSGVGPGGHLSVTVAWGAGRTAGAVQLEVERI